MRRATVILSLVCIVVGPIAAACGDTGDSKLSNGQDLPPGTQLDGGGVDGTTQMMGGDDAGSTPDDSGSMSDPDTGSMMGKDSGQQQQKDSGSGSVDSGHD